MTGGHRDTRLDHSARHRGESPAALGRRLAPARPCRSSGVLCDRDSRASPQTIGDRRRPRCGPGVDLGPQRGSENGRRYDVVLGQVGGRHFGRNALPSRVVVSTHGPGLVALGRPGEKWIGSASCWSSPPRRRRCAHGCSPIPIAPSNLPRKCPGSAPSSGSIAIATPGSILREISARASTPSSPRRSARSASMLGVSSTAAGFLTDLGLRAKPEMVRIRVSSSLGLPTQISELALRATELRELAIAPRSAIVIENEVTYLRSTFLTTES